MIKHCVNCGKKFNINNPKKKYKGKLKSIRGSNSINCSKKCSWIYSCMNKTDKKIMKGLHYEKFGDETDDEKNIKKN